MASAGGHSRPIAPGADLHGLPRARSKTELPARVVAPAPERSVVANAAGVIVARRNLPVARAVFHLCGRRASGAMPELTELVFAPAPETAIAFDRAAVTAGHADLTPVVGSRQTLRGLGIRGFRVEPQPLGVAAVTPAVESARRADAAAESRSGADRGPVAVGTHLGRDGSGLCGAEPGLPVSVAAPTVERAGIGDGAAVELRDPSSHSRREPVSVPARSTPRAVAARPRLPADPGYLRDSSPRARARRCDRARSSELHRAQHQRPRSPPRTLRPRRPIAAKRTERTPLRRCRRLRACCRASGSRRRCTLPPPLDRARRDRTRGCSPPPTRAGRRLLASARRSESIKKVRAEVEACRRFGSRSSRPRTP